MCWHPVRQASVDKEDVLNWILPEAVAETKI